MELRGSCPLWESAWNHTLVWLLLLHCHASPTLLLVSLGHTFLINYLHTNSCLPVCFWGMRPKTQGILGGMNSLGKTVSLGRWKAWLGNSMVCGLWLETEFDIEPCQIHSFMRHLRGNSYEPSAGFSPWDIWTEKKRRLNPCPGTAYILTGQKENKE